MANPVNGTISYQTHYAFERRGEGVAESELWWGHGGGGEWARVGDWGEGERQEQLWQWRWAGNWQLSEPSLASLFCS